MGTTNTTISHLCNTFHLMSSKRLVNINSLIVLFYWECIKIHLIACNNNCTSNKRKLYCSLIDSHRLYIVSDYLTRDSNLTQTSTLFLVPNWKPFPIVLLSKIRSFSSTYSLISFFMSSANCLGISFKTPLHILTCVVLTTKIFTGTNLALYVKDVWSHFKLGRTKLKGKEFVCLIKSSKTERHKNLSCS